MGIRTCGIGFAALLLLGSAPAQAQSGASSEPQSAQCQKVIAFLEHQYIRENNNWGVHSLSARRAGWQLQQAYENCSGRASQDVSFYDWRNAPQPDANCCWVREPYARSPSN